MKTGPFSVARVKVPKGAAANPDKLERGGKGKRRDYRLHKHYREIQLELF